MEAKRSCLKLADFKKNTAEEETTDWLAACLMPEDEASLSNPPTVRTVNVIPAQFLAFIQMDIVTSEKESSGREERQIIVNRTYSARPGSGSLSSGSFPAALSFNTKMAFLSQFLIRRQNPFGSMREKKL